MAMIGLFLLACSGTAGTTPSADAWQRAAAIPPGWGFFLATIGLCFLLFHAYSEHDLQFRRLYGFLGLALVITGIAMRLLAFKSGYMAWFMAGGSAELDGRAWSSSSA